MGKLKGLGLPARPFSNRAIAGRRAGRFGCYGRGFVVLIWGLVVLGFYGAQCLSLGLMADLGLAHLEGGVLFSAASRADTTFRTNSI